MENANNNTAAKYLVITLDDAGFNEEFYNNMKDVNDAMKEKDLRQELGWGYERVMAYKIDKEGDKTDLNHKLTIA